FWPTHAPLWASNWGPLRYGENPHQEGELLSTHEEASQMNLVFASGPDHENIDVQKELSFNNYADASAALELCAELTRASSAGPSGLKPGAPLGVGRALREEPRASARAALRKEQASDTPTAFSEPDPNSPAWLLTWTAYGSWLPGDERGFVSRRPGDSETHVTSNIPGTPYDSDQRELSEAAKKRMKGSPVTLDQEHAPTILASFVETATTHHIAIIAVSIMPDHVHLLCQGEQSGSQLLQLFKGAASRRMNRAHALTDAPRWWTESGSKKYIQKGGNVQSAVQYVCSQKDALCTRSFQDVAPGSTNSLRSAARAEARGSSPASTHAACCFIKHTNACGAAVGSDPIEAYRGAYLGDPNAAMGGILAVNFNVDAEFATAVMETYQRCGKPLKEAGKPYAPGAFFIEVWLAPAFDEEAVRIIRGDVEGKPQKAWGKRVRLLDVGDMSTEPDPHEMDFKRIAGGVLMQNRDLVGLNEEQWKVVTEREPTNAELDDLRLAWLICKHTKSNAITICKDGMLLGNGAGQMSRVMSCRIATWLAKDNGHDEKLKGAVAASDAFFPFRDGPDLLADAGVTAIIQPGGSKRDQEVIAACNERSIAMIFAGTRHFKH
ncbi:MAG: transposase, partial [Planctomycetes bacterium]|nr:transposase [Planctomycetota bacterium]